MEFDVAVVLVKVNVRYGRELLGRDLPEKRVKPKSAALAEVSCFAKQLHLRQPHSQCIDDDTTSYRSWTQMQWRRIEESV